MNDAAAPDDGREDAERTDAVRTDDTLVPLEARVLTLWRIRAGLALAAVTVPAVGLALAVAEGVPSIAIAVIIVCAAVNAALAWWWTARVWRSWQFRIGDGALHLRHGVLTRVESTIPLHRVQHIDTEAGPIERRLSLTTFVLRTASAGSDATVPGIDADDAASIRARILALVGTDDAT